MDQQTVGTVVSATKPWWLKVNTKPVRLHGLDGAIFPYVIKVSYTVAGTPYTKRKWIPAGKPVPAVGSTVKVLCSVEKPAKATILL